jgi:2-polyprenyl-3-methyl-5-hydroxy-6-metoxy-1,4-benzoquinol methylase
MSDSYLKEIIPCPVCENQTTSTNVSASNILGLPNNIDSSVYKCKKCTSSFLFPPISAERLSELYNKSYFTGEDTNQLLPSSGADYETEFAENRVSKYVRSIKLLLSYLPQAKTILDIGAATGKFLSIAKNNNLNVYGIEYSEYASTKAKEKYGFELFTGDFHKYKAEIKYDIIHLNHVFEHLNNPIQSVQKISELIAPNGIVYIEVPYQFNIIERLKFLLFNVKKEFDVFSVHHPIFFTPNSLKYLFEAHGYHCIYIKVFDKNRYPKGGIINSIKKYMWLILSIFNQGVMIETIFSKGPSNSMGK